jgi:hypothetical protein
MKGSRCAYRSEVSYDQYRDAQRSSSLPWTTFSVASIGSVVRLPPRRTIVAPVLCTLGGLAKEHLASLASSPPGGVRKVSDMGQTPLDSGTTDAHDREARASVEELMDEILEQSFPASDAPAWGVVSARVEQMAQSPPSGAPTVTRLSPGRQRVSQP